ncbi:MAG: DEAD/DEAH box helicase, partial [Phycisphaerales bacterium]
MSSFESLSLVEPLLRALAEADHHTPTPIQLQAIPAAMAGRDVMGCAQTGTGKTGAFTLPLLNALLLDESDRQTPTQADSSHGGTPRGHGRGGRGKRQGGRAHRSRGGGAFQAKPRALVLSPTRELAAQIGDSVEMYGRFTGLRHAIIFGGVHQSRQTRDFAGGVDVLIATPGRLEDLVQQRLVDLSQVRVLVLDEADRMLDMGFVVPVKRIADQTRAGRQTMLFSATMPRGVEKLARELLTEPERIAVDPVSSAVDTIEQQVYMVDRNRKQDLLENLLKDEAVKRAVVFTRTKYGADRVGKRLERGGMTAGILHGDRNQNQRTRALEAFRRGHSQVLVATDVAARGLDVDGITHVFNFDLPMDPESYVHRIGRTGRAGNSGVAVAFCDRSERGTLRSIERLTGTRIDVMREVPLPRVDDRGVVVGTTKPRKSTSTPTDAAAVASTTPASEADSASVLTASDGQMITMDPPKRRERQDDGPDPRTRVRIARRSTAETAEPVAASTGTGTGTYDRPSHDRRDDRDNGGFRGKPGGHRPYGNRDDRDNGGFRGKPSGSRPYGNRDDRDNGGFRGKPGGSRPYGNRDDRGGNSSGGGGGYRGQSGGSRPYGNRDDRGGNSGGGGGYRGQSGGSRPYGNRDDRGGNGGGGGGYRGQSGGSRPYGNRDDRGGNSGGGGGGDRGRSGGSRPHGNRDD